MCKVSVIMATYNAETSIEKCILSVLNQTYKNIELIIINDGSIDNTDNIVNNLKIKDERIRYYRTLNKGVSSARNTGLSYAKGEFVSFIDSDDYYELNMLEILVNALYKYNADLVSCSYERVRKVKVIPETTYFEKGYYNKEKLMSEIYPSIISDKSLSYTVPLNIVTKLFKNRIIKKNNIQFNKKMRKGEDLLFCREYFLYADSFYYIPDQRLYKYSYNDTSATNTLSKDRKTRLPVSLNSQNSLCQIHSRFNLDIQLPYYHTRIAVASVVNLIRYMNGTRREIVNELSWVIENEQIIESCKVVDPSNFNISRRVVFELIKRKKYNLLYIITKIHKFK